MAFINKMKVRVTSIVECILAKRKANENMSVLCLYKKIETIWVPINLTLLIEYLLNRIEHIDHMYSYIYQSCFL